MAGTFFKYYLEGFLVGSMVTSAIIVLFLFFYIKESRKKRPVKETTAVTTINIRPAMKKAIRESALYLMIAFALFLFLYLLITPFMPYSGTVERKDYRVRGRTMPATKYFIYVDGRKLTVDEDIYGLVRPGDKVMHRVASQCYYINGRARMAGVFAWNTAFWAGVLAMSFFALCAGTFYYRLHRERKLKCLTG